MGFFLSQAYALAESSRIYVESLGPWGVAAFSLAYILAIVLLIPGAPFSIGAGLLFGFRSLPLVSLCATLGASLAFLLSRHLARKKVVRWLARRPRVALLMLAVEESGGKIVFLLRLSPVIPFNFQNYLLGTTGIGFRAYFLSTFLGMIPGSMLYVYLGTLGQPGYQATRLELAFFGVGVLATFLVSWIVGRRWKKLDSQRRA